MLLQTLGPSLQFHYKTFSTTTTSADFSRLTFFDQAYDR